jgi:hypothetical protein
MNLDVVSYVLLYHRHRKNVETRFNVLNRESIMTHLKTPYTILLEYIIHLVQTFLISLQIIEQSSI